MDQTRRPSPRLAGPPGREFGITGLSEDDLVHINLGWHRLHPWPDSVPGLTRLKSRFIIGPLSNGNVSLLLNMAKFAAIPWDMIFGSDLFGHFKPDPETYLGVAKLLDLRPDQVMMAAAHNGDLAAARRCGLLTAFFPAPASMVRIRSATTKPIRTGTSSRPTSRTWQPSLACDCLALLFATALRTCVKGGSMSQVASQTAKREEVFMDDIVIVSAARTPVGSFNGALSTIHAHELGAIALQAAMSRAGVDPTTWTN